MDFYQRKAIASSMGLNEQQLALVMRGNFNVGPVPKTAEEIEELEKQLVNTNRECVFMWTNKQGEAFGVVMAYLPKDGKIWMTAAERRATFPACN